MNELLPGLRHWRTHNPDIDYDAGDLHGGGREALRAFCTS